MRVDTICTKMGLETDKSIDIESGSTFIDVVKARNDLECEKKLRQKMADKVTELEKKLQAERKKAAELKFIRENDN